MFNKVIFVITILVTSLYVMPVTAQDACDGQVGAAFGLCNAYCEAMDCDSTAPQASENACNEIYDQFFTHTGSPPPCEVSCPCFTFEDLVAGGTVVECGENFPGFPDLAAANYESGDQACSGSLCASASELSCAYNGPNGSVVTGIESGEDLDCRALILANCYSPNLSPSDLAPSAAVADGAVFMDQ